MAHAMDDNAFRDRERVIAAIDNERIGGYCTAAKKQIASPVFRIRPISVLYSLTRHTAETDQANK